VQIAHIPYKGGPPAYADLMAGQVDMMFQGLATAMPQITDGRLRVLAIGSEKRHSALPQTPTLNESLPGFVSVSWSGLVAPPRTPAAIVKRLSDTIGQELRAIDSGKQVKGFDMRDVIASTPEEAVRFTREERDRWGAVIKSTGVTVD
jgi:tripartite-type tricarboxylate transporter receptor subunit TctC